MIKEIQQVKEGNNIFKFGALRWSSLPYYLISLHRISIASVWLMCSLLLFLILGEVTIVQTIWEKAESNWSQDKGREFLMPVCGNETKFFGIRWRMNLCSLKEMFLVLIGKDGRGSEKKVKMFSIVSRTGF